MVSFCIFYMKMGCRASVIISNDSMIKSIFWPTKMASPASISVAMFVLVDYSCRDEQSYFRCKLKPAYTLGKT